MFGTQVDGCFGDYLTIPFMEFGRLQLSMISNFFPQLCYSMFYFRHSMTDKEFVNARGNSFVSHELKVLITPPFCVLLAPKQLNTQQATRKSRIPPIWDAS